MKKTMVSLMCGLGTVFFALPVAFRLITLETPCKHLNTLAQYGQQEVVDGQYSVDVRVSCKDCEQVFRDAPEVSDEEIDIEELANRMIYEIANL